jgi:hypothetical protein
VGETSGAATLHARGGKAACAGKHRNTSSTGTGWAVALWIVWDKFVAVKLCFEISVLRSSFAGSGWRNLVEE